MKVMHTGQGKVNPLCEFQDLVHIMSYLQDCIGAAELLWMQHLLISGEYFLQCSPLHRGKCLPVTDLLSGDIYPNTFYLFYFLG